MFDFLLTETEGLIPVPPVLFVKLDLLPQFFLLCLGSNVENQSLLRSQILSIGRWVFIASPLVVWLYLIPVLSHGSFMAPSLGAKPSCTELVQACTCP